MWEAEWAGLPAPIWIGVALALALAIAYALGRVAGRPRGQADVSVTPALERRLQAQERALAQILADALDRAGRRTAEAERHTGAAAGALTEQVTALARQQQGLAAALAALQGVLDNKQARGAFGEVQLERLVADLLPANAYALQAQLGAGRVDCLILLDWPPGPVPVDAKFPLEAYRNWLAATGDAKASQAALRDFQRDVARHVEAIRSKYLVRGETADFALMFLPSEAVFAALHAECRGLVESARRSRVFPVSPSTLWPLLNTLSAALRDVAFAAQTAPLQAAAERLAGDGAALAEHARRLERDWSRLGADLQALIAAADALAAGGRAFANLPPVDRAEVGPPAGDTARDAIG